MAKSKKGKEPAGLRRYRLAQKRKKAGPKRKKAAAKKKRVVQRKPIGTRHRKRYLRKRNKYTVTPGRTTTNAKRRVRRKPGPKKRRRVASIGAVIHTSPHGVMATMRAIRNPLM